METTRALMPRARQDELVVEELRDETLVYDLERHKARCLNPTAALVWRHCDGQTSVAEVAALLEEQSATPADESVVWMALDRLSRAHLLSEPVTLPAERARYSRRHKHRVFLRLPASPVHHLAAACRFVGTRATAAPGPGKNANRRPVDGPEPQSQELLMNLPG